MDPVTNEARKQSLLDAVSLISSAERLLMQLIRRSSDPATLLRLNTEYARLDSLLSEMLHANAFSEDVAFASAAAALKRRALRLQDHHGRIESVVPDIGAASTIDDYIAQAMDSIASL